MKGCSGWPSSCLRRLAASGGPWRTAKTPALGRGCSSTAATSPAAKTAAQLVEASVGCTWLGLGLGLGLGLRLANPNLEP